jgi:hypothetical protein
MADLCVGERAGLVTMTITDFRDDVCGVVFFRGHVSRCECD